MSEEKKFSFVDFLINAPLYKEALINGDTKTYLKFLKHECFCELCKKEKTFNFYDIINYPLTQDSIVIDPDVPSEFLLQLECTNCGGLISYCLKIEEGKIKKIGQNPPFSMLEKNEMSKYRVEMPEFYHEYTTALNSFSNGSALAAFLLGRRIFSRLLDIDYKKFFPHGKDRNLTEKIRSLEADKHYIFPPDADTLKNQILFELDKDIVEYEEAECEQNFPFLKLCIEFMAEKLVEEKRRANRLREATRSFKKPN